MKTLSVKLGPFTREIKYDEITPFITLKKGAPLYYLIAAENIIDAYKIRNTKFPKKINEDNVYYEVRQ